jgi:hypothetical protein
MPSIVTNNFRIHNAKQFLRSLSYGDANWDNSVEGPQSTESFLYLYIGKARPWEETHSGSSDSNIPSPANTLQENEYEIWRDMLALQKLANTDISHAAKRINWTSGTVYEMYDDKNTTIVTGTGNGHYILTVSGTEYNVFKCIHRDNSAHQSTIEPTKRGSVTAEIVPQTETDGYVWKYMYSLPSAVATKFMTTNFLPVRTLTANQVSGADSVLTAFNLGAYVDQKKVQIYANTGTIEAYAIDLHGTGYLSSESDGITSTALTTLSTNTITVTAATGLSVDNDRYNGLGIYVANTTKVWGVTRVHDYDGTAKTFVCDPAFTDTDFFGGDDGGLAGGGIDDGGGAGLATATFHLGPLVTIEGDGGKNSGTAPATYRSNTAVARATTTAGGAIWKVLPVVKGKGYTFANVHIQDAPTGTGAGAIVRAVISPPGGHGSNPVSELNAYNVVVNSVISLATLNLANSFPSDNEYRRIGLIRNPLLANTSEHLVTSGADGVQFANTTTLHQTLMVTVNNTVGHGGTWMPAKDERVYGESSNAYAYVIEYDKYNNRTLVLGEIQPNSSATFGHTQGSLSGSFVEYDKIVLASDASKYITANGAAGAAGNIDPGRTGWADGGWTQEAIRGPELIPYSGEILYSETRAPISRSANQTEDIKIVFEF